MRRSDNVGGSTSSHPHGCGEATHRSDVRYERANRLGAFVRAFTSLGNEYHRFIKQTEPNLAGEADLFCSAKFSIREHLVIHLVPWLSMIAPFINNLERR